MQNVYINKHFNYLPTFSKEIGNNQLIYWRINVRENTHIMKEIEHSSME